MKTLTEVVIEVLKDFAAVKFCETDDLSGFFC